MTTFLGGGRIRVDRNSTADKNLETLKTFSADVYSNLRLKGGLASLLLDKAYSEIGGAVESHG